MSEAWYQGKGRQHEEAPVQLPPSPLDSFDDPQGYVADPGLVDAVNVALHLGQPLLLTGAPGTGKTQLAYSLAWELGFGEVLKFETKSTSTSRDLFYTYDALGRFNAVYSGEGSKRALDYIRWNALGLAVLYSCRADKVVHEGDEAVREPVTTADLLAPEEHPGEPRRSVVLIDEIDKAPRDFPNDLLSEVEGMYFKVPEFLNLRLAAERDMRPVLVLTSNSEKNLSPAFLRRCLFYDIPFPDEARLRDIIHRRISGEVLGEELLQEALALFAMLRGPAAGLVKPPSTGELLAWLRVLTSGPHAVEDGGLRDPRLLEPTVCTLVKTKEDRGRARAVIEKKWLGRSTH